MREAFAVQKLLTFFQQKYWCILDIYVKNFNETLTNGVVSFELPGPEQHTYSIVLPIVVCFQYSLQPHEQKKHIEWRSVCAGGTWNWVETKMSKSAEPGFILYLSQIAKQFENVMQLSIRLAIIVNWNQLLCRSIFNRLTACEQFGDVFLKLLSINNFIHLHNLQAL